jgi:hypothetical protein
MQLDEASVAGAPAAPGVYFLYRRERLLYVGIAVHGTGIRQELEKHIKGEYGARTRAATAFEYEETRDPVLASREHLLAHMAQNRGRLPPCNRAEALASAIRADGRELRADR